MLYDIYFHNDFDGRASAAVMLAFLRSHGDDIEHYIPVKYDIIPEWIDENFLQKNKLFKGKHNPAIIVDFPFHPQATFWFDHHVRPFRKEGWEKKFKTDKFRRYNDTYRSACSLVMDSLKKDFGWKPPANIKDLAKWLDVIDGARYKSAAQTIAMKEPAIQINNFIEENASDLKLTIWTIQELSRTTLANFAKLPRVKNFIKKLYRNTDKALDFYRKKMRIVGNVMITDLTGFPFAEMGHYAPYYLYPKKDYAIRFHPFPGKPTLFHVNVGSNPWRLYDKSKHIGNLLKGYGGGGHRGVGGVEIEGRKKTLQVVEEIVKFLNN